MRVVFVSKKILFDALFNILLHLISGATDVAEEAGARGNRRECEDAPKASDVELDEGLRLVHALVMIQLRVMTETDLASVVESKDRDDDQVDETD